MGPAAIARDRGLKEQVARAVEARTRDTAECRVPMLALLRESPLVVCRPAGHLPYLRHECEGVASERATESYARLAVKQLHVAKTRRVCTCVGNLATRAARTGMHAYSRHMPIAGTRYACL